VAKGYLIIASGLITPGNDLTYTPAAGIGAVIVSGGTGSGAADMDVKTNYGDGRTAVLLNVDGFQDGKVLVYYLNLFYLVNNNVGDQSMGLAGVQLS